MGFSLRVIGLLIVLLFFSVVSGFGSSTSSESGFSRFLLGSELAPSTEPPGEIIYLPPVDGLSSDTDGGVIIITPTTLPAETTTTETTTTTTAEIDTTTSSTLPEIGSKITSDYKAEKGAYTTVFKPDGSGVEVSIYGVPLQFKPINLRVGDTDALADVSDLHHAGEDILEYHNVFGGKGRVEYELKDKQLKESIVFEDLVDLPSTQGLINWVDAVEEVASSTTSTDHGADSPATSTARIGFSLMFPDETVLSLDGKNPWSGKTTRAPGDVYLIRKKTPGRLYLINRFFRIIKPNAVDSSGDRVDLAYTLSKEGDQTLLTIELPGSWLEKATYPVNIDPTIGMDGIDGWYRFTNAHNCSTAANDCTSITDTPSGNDVSFKIDDGCASSGDAIKDVFEFYLEGLEADYDEDLLYAKMYFHGDCDDMNNLPNSYTLAITQIDPYVDPSPQCSDDPFGDYRTDVYELNGEGTSYTCQEGDLSVYVTSIMQDALDDSESYLAFKLDLDPPNRYNDYPVGGNAGYYISRTSEDLYIEYYFTCYDSGDCPNDEFCLDSSTDMCWADHSDGENCEDKAVDNDDYACEHGVCEFDGFDGSEHYCSNGTACVHDYTLYDYGVWHCEGSDWAKQCQGSGDWGVQINCGWGCDEGTGCATTTTTTTTTSTTTTIAPNINVNPTEIIITVIK
jgi:hypothetical protein